VNDDLPNDQSLRDEFVSATDANFSVGCPAGSGKTRAIADRIASIAKGRNSVEVLAALCVVTFTQKAAKEIQERARAQVLRAKPSPQVLMAFNRGFFGTINSFAVTLLRSYGHYLGVPSLFGVLETDDDIWRAFLQEHNGRPTRMDSGTFDLLTRIFPFGDLLDLVRSYDFTRQEPVKAGRMPEVDLGEVLAHALPKRVDQASNIERHQKSLREWRDSVRIAGDFLPLPSPETGGKEFIGKVNAALDSVRRWQGLAVAETVHYLALDYRDFRIRKGQLTFNDQVALAAALFKNGRAARQMRAKGYRVLLDEAQDTDPHQFSLLLEISRPIEAAKTDFLETLAHGPRPGHFSMVGDPQQSIYGSRADLGYYLAVERALVASGSAKSLNFAVTFRCDRNLVDFANAAFPAVLTGQRGQVPFVKLQSRPGAGAGQVIRVPISAPPSDMGGARDLALESARQLARWLKSTGLQGLRAPHWGEVALICPRKDWFHALRRALTECGLKCQLQSTREVNADCPAFAWTCGLLAAFAEPRNALEIFGVLREVFGISDDSIARYVDRKPERLNLTDVADGKCPVALSLKQLSACREFFSRLSLREALGAACEHINLRGRLMSLPTEAYPGLLEALDSVLLRASAAEASGQTLESFARELRGLSLEQVEIREARDDALPIITNLKSKGLQWSAVVLPFFGREISYRSLPYPRFLPSACAHPIAFSSSEIPEEWRQRISVANSQEAERLLYVSLTRATHTLVIADDVGFWSGTDESAAINSFAKALQVDGVNKGAWECLPGIATADATLVEASTEGHELLPQISLERPGAIPAAVGKFPRRILPHLLVATHRRGRKIEDPEQAATVSHDQLLAELQDSGAVRYGTWWHNMMQATPWAAGEKSRDTVFRQLLEACPDPDRGAREWRLFLRSNLGVKLFSGKLRIRVELPFMAPLKKGDSVDGIIDLAALDPDTGTWLIVDWKTNCGFSAPELLERYRGQIEAYTDSFSALTDGPVAGWLYSTEAGEGIAV
jgi:ATP-dependent helicase/nuclease subunit A